MRREEDDLVVHLWENAEAIPLLEPVPEEAPVVARVAGAVVPRSEVNRRTAKLTVEDVPRSPGWNAIGGRRIRVLGDAGLEVLKETLTYADLLRALLNERFGKNRKDVHYRFRIYSEEAHFRRYAVLSGAPQAESFYAPSTREVVLSVTRHATPELYQRAVAHEFIHAWMDLEWDTTGPLWFAEGMAELFSNVGWEGRRRRYVEGTPPQSVINTLKYGELLPLDRFFSAGRNDFYGQMFYLLYAQAWAFVHFLLAAEPAVVEAMLKHRGAAPRDLAVLEGAFRAYLSELLEE